MAVAAAALAAGCDDDRDEARVQQDSGSAQRRLYKVPTENMEPALRFRQIVELDPTPGEIRPGDIVVFHPPANVEDNVCAVRPKPAQACPGSAATTLPFEFVKRVVAVGGDSLVIEGGRARVNGEIEPQQFIPDDVRCKLCNLPTPVTVPRGHLYVLGDRRTEPSDSRKWGPIRKQWVVGKVLL